MVDAPSVLPQGHTGAVNSVAYSSDGTQLASGSGDNTVRIWDVASGECRATLEVRFSSFWRQRLSVVLATGVATCILRQAQRDWRLAW